ncbi:MAG TPA: ABC transporter ATP-binding protein [Candidatus Gallacutalibacter pullistercoris]|nr:ABC transporter ATP-binding protein [Candidatus Gallacutalibacter pullistercoris]
MIPFIKPYGEKVLLIVLLMLVNAAVDISYPLFQGYAIDTYIIPQTVEGIWPFAILYFIILTIQSLSTIIFCRVALTVEMYLGRDLKRAVFNHLQTLSFSYYNTTPVGTIVARTMSDTNKIGSMFAWSLVDIFWAASFVIGSMATMLFINWRLALPIIAIVPFIAIITVFFQKRILAVNRRVRRINSDITRAYNEGITGARTSKTLVIEEQNLREFSVIIEDMRATSVHATMLNALYIPIIVFFSSLAVCFVLVQGGYLNIQQALNIGTLSVFISYALNIFEPIQQLARIVANFISIQANIERVTDLLELEPKIQDTPEVIEKYGTSFDPKKENWEPIRGDITFEDVSFRYPDGNEDVLSHFNLHIPAGTTVAIVGETGAGKSTLVNLACRFFEPTGGRILIDGKDYRERSMLWLHSSIGYVLQTPHLFSGTVRENLRYGRLDATDEEIEAAAKLVSAHDTIMHMENGYESDVGEGGDHLSTGEKQLVSFARAVLADPRIFVLDEATSSIDTKTEELIQHAISTLLENRTSFLIAHRLSTIRKADLILVVRHGKIVEQGTHEELLAAGGYYHDLYTRQFEQEASEEVFGS